MKHTATLLALVLLPLAAGAQEAVTAGGGTAEGGGYALTYSVGQTAVATAADGQLREGVVQPITVEDVGVPGGAELSSAVTVFPNPTMDGVTFPRTSASEDESLNQETHNAPTYGAGCSRERRLPSV